MKSRFLITALAVLALSVSAAAQMPAPTPPPAGPEGYEFGGPQMPGPGGPPAAEHPFSRQPELGQWWKNSEVVNELRLTEAQIKQIEDRFLQHQLALIDANAEVQKNEAKLGALMNADQFNEQQATAQIDQLLAARSKLGKEFALMLLDVRRALTPEQWKKLHAMHEHRRMHAPGPMHQPRPEGGGMPRRPGPTPPPGEM